MFDVSFVQVQPQDVYILQVSQVSFLSRAILPLLTQSQIWILNALELHTDIRNIFQLVHPLPKETCGLLVKLDPRILMCLTNIDEYVQYICSRLCFMYVVLT